MTERIGSGEGYGDSEGEVTKISLHSTCHLALDRCIKDKICTHTLTPILQACDISRYESKHHSIFRTRKNQITRPYFQLRTEQLHGRFAKFLSNTKCAMELGNCILPLQVRKL